MEKFIKIFEKSFIETVEGLIGEKPSFKYDRTQNTDVLENITYDIVLIDIKVQGDIDTTMKLGMYPYMAVLLSNLMLGDDSKEKREVNEDDLDAVKEIISNCFGMVQTYLSSQKELPLLKFNIDNIEYIKDERKKFNYELVETFDMELLGIKSELILLNNHISNSNNITKENNKIDVSVIDEVKLPLRVRIGKKKMILSDALSLDIGSVVELETLINANVEILVGEVVIGFGEVVVIDGNFGVQITSIKGDIDE